MPEERKIFTKEEIANQFDASSKIKVVFEKKDGTIRTMVCTRNMETIPEAFRPQPGESSDRPGRPTPEHLFSAFDLENDGWRSFTIDKVLSIEPIL